MDTIEALKICRLSSKINNVICNNANFWRRKIEKEYDINIIASNIRPF